MDVNEIRKFAKERMNYDSSGHDFWHAMRVANLAKKLYKEDNTDIDKNSMFIIETAAFLHDTIDDKLVKDVNERLKEIEELLSNEHVEEDMKSNIFYIIQHMSYSKNLKFHYELSLEGQYVQDADRIDALGAVGIARAFAYGGHAGDEIYNPEIAQIELTSKKQYREHRSTTINHFYEKLLLLENTMNTVAGKDLAKERTKYMKNFLDEFKEEWNGLR